MSYIYIYICIDHISSHFPISRLENHITRSPHPSALPSARAIFCPCSPAGRNPELSWNWFRPWRHARPEIRRASASTSNKNHGMCKVENHGCHEHIWKPTINWWYYIINLPGYHKPGDFGDGLFHLFHMNGFWLRKLGIFHQQSHHFTIKIWHPKMGSAPSERVELRDTTSKGKDFNSLKMRITIF